MDNVFRGLGLEGKTVLVDLGIGNPVAFGVFSGVDHTHLLLNPGVEIQKDSIRENTAGDLYTQLLDLRVSDKDYFVILRKGKQIPGPILISRTEARRVTIYNLDNDTYRHIKGNHEMKDKDFEDRRKIKGTGFGEI